MTLHRAAHQERGRHLALIRTNGCHHVLTIERLPTPTLAQLDDLPPVLVDGLSTILSREVLAMMSYRGVRNFSELIARCCFDVISGVEHDSGSVVEAVAGGRPIRTFMWMPRELILATDEQAPSSCR